MPKLADSPYLKKYKKRLFKMIKRMHPDWDDELLNEVIDKEIKKNIQNPKMEMDNNYTGEHQDASLMSIFDWVLKEKPIIAGNGTFYKNQYKALNPVATMLNAILQNRKDTKKKMFKVEDEDSDIYKDLDRLQKNYKILVNSYYGASGMPSSPFYSKWSGPATTLTAQQIISTTENTFEAFVADNYSFLDFNEFCDWADQVLSDSDVLIDPWVKDVDPDKLSERISNHIIKLKSGERDMIDDFTYHLSSTERKILYYKNNLIQFVKDHPNIQDLYESIFQDTINNVYVDKNDQSWRRIVTASGGDPTGFDSADAWNKHVNHEYFMDPNSVPDSIKDKVKQLSDILVAYVYTPYMPFERVYRLKNFKRKTVTVIDTDSNILALDTWVNWTLDEVLKSTYGRDKLKNVFVAVNTLTYVLTEVVSRSLLQYGEFANVPEEFRPRLNMKNEFMFIKLIIGKRKKRYLSKVILREGNLMLKPKTDVKGFDFIKSTTSAESEKFFKGLIDKYLMGDEIDSRGLLAEIRSYSVKIEDSLRNKELHYLPNIAVKPITQYKNPASQQSVKGMLIWNYVYPDDELDVPSKPKILKLNIFKESDLEPLKYTYPDVYDTLKEKVFNDTTGIFVKYKKDKKSGKMIRVDAGCPVICIPTNRQIPDWCLDYIDYQTTINNILAPFKSVTEILGIQDFQVGKTINGIQRKSSKISNIIRF